ncbi:hypothetical protein Ddye_030172, partial [Dipteronia dyeriana]
MESQVKSNPQNNLIYGQQHCGKCRMREESWSRGINGEVISVYTVKSIFDGMKKTYVTIEYDLNRKAYICLIHCGD